jgi:hypothetical protein
MWYSIAGLADNSDRVLVFDSEFGRYSDRVSRNKEMAVVLADDSDGVWFWLVL